MTYSFSEPENKPQGFIMRKYLSQDRESSPSPKRNSGRALQIADRFPLFSGVGVFVPDEDWSQM
jgi:hypothetical protein